MVTSAVDGIDLFKIAGRSISGWIPSFKAGVASPARQPFCSQLEERLLLWLEYNPQVVSYARGDIGPSFAATYRLPLPKDAPFTIGYTFEGKPHDYLPDVVGKLSDGKLFIAEAGVEEVESRLVGQWPVPQIEASLWKMIADAAARGHLLLDLEQITLDCKRPLALLSPNAPPLPPSALPDTLVLETPEVQEPVSLPERTSEPMKSTTVDASALPEAMREQFHRRMDKLEPFCRIAGHTSEEVRAILATLEIAYRELFPQLNLRQWSGIIYTWLTQSLLDPTNSGRISMDNLMKLVTTALEWTYEAGLTDVKEETLEEAADLLMLRRDTFRIIDGAGPSVNDQDASSERPAQTEPGDEEQASQASAPKPEQEGMESQKQPATQPKCTFHGEVSIDLQQFSESGVDLVECPDCTSTSALSPHKGILHFKPHKRRKTRSTSTEPRWVRREMIWAMVGGTELP